MADTPQILKIPIGRYFSALLNGPADAAITVVTAGGKPAFPGVPLRVTPNMRLVIQGRNLPGYNRALITTSTNKTYTVIPKFSRDAQFTYVAFDVPDYGDENFIFRLRLESSRPDVAAVEIDRKFDYAQETEEEKQDREKKAAEAAAAQEKAEQEQKNIKRDEFEKNRAAGLTAVGNIGAVAGGVLGAAAEGLAAAALAVDKAAPPVVHKWQGTADKGHESAVNPSEQVQTSASGTAIPTGPAAQPAPAGVSDITGQAAVIRRAPAQEAGGVPQQRVPRQSAAQQSYPAAASRGGQVQMQSSSSISGSGGGVGSKAVTSKITGSGNEPVIGTAVARGVSGTIGVPASGSVSQTVGTSASLEGKAASTSKASVSGSLSAEDNLTVEQRASLHESVEGKQTITAGVVIAEPPAVPVPTGGEKSGGAISIEEKSPKSPQTPSRPNPAKPFEDRKTLKLKAEYDAKFKAFRPRVFDVKLKRPETITPGAPVSADRIRRGGDSTGGVPTAPEMVNGQNTEPAENGPEVSGQEDDENEEPTVPNIPEELTGENAPAELEAPQLPADLQTRGAAAEVSKTATAEAGGAAAGGGAVAGAEAGGAMAGAAEGAMVLAPEVALPVAAAGMMATKDGRDKAIKAAADVIAGPEAGIAISFFKKHWKLIVGLLTAVVVAVLGLVLVFLLTLTQWMCTHWETYGLIYLSGYKNVCTAIQNAGAGNILPAGATVGQLNTNPGNGQCTPVVSGPASVASLQSTCFGGDAQQASSISEAESGGQATEVSRTDICADGNSVSIGLFQINLTNHPINGLNCPAAFSSEYSASNKTCIVVNQALYQSCVTAAENPAYNIAEACVISNNGASWTQWGSHTKCGL